jgi:hypothetical protein
MFKLFSDIYFIVYKLYYVGQNDDLGIRVSLRNWDGGSTLRGLVWLDICALKKTKTSYIGTEGVFN